MFITNACLMIFETIIALLSHGAVVQDYDLTLHILGSGGGSGAGRDIEFGCTVGQPIAGIGGSEEYILFGGYWGAASRRTAPGDCNRDGIIRLNDFACFANCFTGERSRATTECTPFDLDSDGDVDGKDYQTVFAQLGV